jgi:hypothetical protein
LKLRESLVDVNGVNNKTKFTDLFLNKLIGDGPLIKVFLE